MIMDQENLVLRLGTFCPKLFPPILFLHTRARAEVCTVMFRRPPPIPTAAPQTLASEARRPEQNDKVGARHGEADALHGPK